MLALTYAQVAWFRARRTGLVDGFASLSAAAAGLLGAQSQIEAPSRWSLALRTAGHPTAADVRAALLEDRTLIRAWGQRDTVHLYATDDWHLIAAAHMRWPNTARRPPYATDDEVHHFIADIERFGRPFTRSDLLGIAPGRLVDAFTAAPVNNDPPDRMAISRLINQAGHDGGLCALDTVGREQRYVARRVWVPRAAWPAISAHDAAVALCRRYLAAWGPARVQDAAHYFGARVTEARTWFDALADETVPLSVDGIDGHWALRADVDELRQPPVEPRWPARLLPAYDTQMMSHGHKDPLLVDAADRPRVWGKAAIVNATVFHQGRFAATWKHKATKRAVSIEVEPLTGSDSPDVAQAIAQAVERDGAALGRHLGVAT